MEQRIVQSTDKPAMVDLDKWQSALPDLKATYGQEKPFPHIVLDDFLEAKAAQKALAAFPSVQDDGWIHYVHYNEKKHGLNKMELLPKDLQQLIRYCNQPLG